MVAWIGASHEDRMRFYIVPEARRALREDWAGKARADILRRVEEVEATYAADTSSLRDRKRERRLVTLRREYQDVARAEAGRRAILAGEVR